jgi:hypothetical protein
MCEAYERSSPQTRVRVPFYLSREVFHSIAQTLQEVSDDWGRPVREPPHQTYSSHRSIENFMLNDVLINVLIEVDESWNGPVTFNEPKAKFR